MSFFNSEEHFFPESSLYYDDHDSSMYRVISLSGTHHALANVVSQSTESDWLNSMHSFKHRIAEDEAKIIDLQRNIMDSFVAANALLGKLVKFYEIASTQEVQVMWEDYLANGLAGKDVQKFLAKLLVNIEVRADVHSPKQKTYSYCHVSEHQTQKMVEEMIQKCAGSGPLMQQLHYVFDKQSLKVSSITAASSTRNKLLCSSIDVNFYDPIKSVMIVVRIPLADFTKLHYETVHDECGQFEVFVKKLGTKEIPVPCTDVMSPIQQINAALSSATVKDKHEKLCDEYAKFCICRSWSFSDCAVAIYNLLTTTRYDEQLNVTALEKLKADSEKRNAAGKTSQWTQH